MMDLHLNIATRTLWQEARGEPLEGQQAVAHVLENRLRSGRWGTTLGEVCLSEYKGIYQFSGWGRNDPNRKLAFAVHENDPLLMVLADLVYKAINGEPDPTGGATHYYAKSMSIPPAWVDGDPAHGTPAAIFCGQFGHQLFYKGVR